MINYRREVNWDTTLVDLEANASTLITQFTKRTSGIPAATPRRFIPAAIAQVNDGTLWYNSGTTALPVWTQISGGGGAGITSINGDVTAAQIIAAGSGISVVTAAGTTTVSNTGVTSFNTLTGAVTISAGANITLTPVGNDIQIAAAGGGGAPGAPLSSLQYNNAGAFGGTNSFYTPGAHPTQDTFQFGSTGDNATVIGYAENASSLRVKGLDFLGNPVQSYAGIFFNAAYNTLGNLQTRVIWGANVEMDSEIQSPNALLLTAVDDTVPTGKILASSKTNFTFNLRADAEVASPKQLIVDRVDTGTTGLANTSDMVLKTSDGSSIHFDEPIAYSNATGLTALGGGQGGALALTEEQNNVTTVTVPGDGVKLPDAVAGLSVKVMNNGASNLAVFPFLGDLIDGGAVNASVTLTPGESCDFMAISTGAWESVCNTVVTDATLTGNGTTGSPLSVVGGAGSLAYAMFYGLTAGTGMGGTDYAATIAVKTAAGTGRVPFPQNGPTSGTITSAIGTTTPALIAEIDIPAIGTYEVSFMVHTTEPGQLQLELTTTGVPADLAYTCVANMNPTAGGHPIGGTFLVTTTAINSKLAVVNPTGNSTALTITPADGADTHANAQTLTIKQIA